MFLVKASSERFGIWPQYRFNVPRPDRFCFYHTEYTTKLTISGDVSNEKGVQFEIRQSGEFSIDGREFPVQ